MTNVEYEPCSICGQTIGTDLNGWAGGHNAEPVTSGRCCEPCNLDMVLPARLLQHRFSVDQIGELQKELDTD